MTLYSAASIHTELDERFYTTVRAAAFPQHILRYRNDRAAQSVGLDDLSDEAWVNHFGKFAPLDGNFPAPRALCYHGHQFGVYNPEIGDGRGFLFAQMQAVDGRVLDLGTKGSGQTPFSRTADGRLTLKGAVREILATEMLEALGVNTSKTFSVIETGESLQRHDEPSPTRAAVLVRLSHSHIRIGSFQRLRFMDDQDGLEMLVRHAARHYFAESLNADEDIGLLAVAFLGAVAARVADTAGAWMASGFVHGVLNTDNFNITGESFDYGPWRFMDRFDASFVAAYFDQNGRYAFGRQPEASLWAVCRLADCLVAFCETAVLEAVLQDFYAQLETSLRKRLCWRLGITLDAEASIGMSKALFAAAREADIGFPQIFHDWYGGRPRRGNYVSNAWQAFAATLKGATPRASANHPFFERDAAVALPIETVEALWAPIAEYDDWQPLYNFIDEIRSMAAALADADDLQDGSSGGSAGGRGK
mgnify:CR=1 FL=1